VRRRRDEPTPLGEVLNVVAGRLKRVDLRVIDEVRRLWPTVVEPVVAQHCRPEFVRDGVLVVRVPSGAFAERVASASRDIVAGFAPLGASAPTSIRCVVGTLD